MRFGLMADCRNPAQWGQPTAELYADVLDHMVAAEALGFEGAEFVEHHFTDDGYLPAPLIMATAVAARTKKMRIGTNVALLPLYDPVRLAEECSVLDALSNGRLDLGVALGYRPEEFAGYRIDLKSRASRTDEALQIIRRLWRGESVSFHGRHFNIDGVRISPLPVQQPAPLLWVGASARPGIRRAAVYGDGFTGAVDKTVYDMYLEELRTAGKDVAKPRIRCIEARTLAISHDPERTFAMLAPHVMYYINAYAKWFEGTVTQGWKAVNSVEELKAANALMVMTPDEAVKYLKDLTAQVPLESFSFPLKPPGIPASQMQESLELFSSKVMPHFR